MNDSNSNGDKVSISLRQDELKQEQQQRRRQDQQQEPVVKEEEDENLPLTAYLQQPPFVDSSTTRMTLNQPSITLRKVVYDQVRQCSDLPQNWPVHHPKSMDNEFGPNVGTLWNNLTTDPSLRDRYADVACPVDADPFLPWIHDVFVNHNLEFVEFVAANKRRCRTSYTFLNDLKNLEPQVSLMQSIPIQRLSKEQIHALDDKHDDNDEISIPRYRLSSYQDADEDGKETRFICRYHTKSNDNKVGKNSHHDDDRQFLGETLSVYPYNYEYANSRKGGKQPMLTTPKDKSDRVGARNEAVWNSIYHFRCPIPKNVQTLMIQQESTTSTKNNDQNSNNSTLATTNHAVRLDLIPIRTLPRINVTYFPQQFEQSSSSSTVFDPDREWGQNYILPKIETVGRLTNIPLCQVRSPPPITTTSSSQVADNAVHQQQHMSKKQQQVHSQSSAKDTPQVEETSSTTENHYVVGCLWTSAAFSTRGMANDISQQDTSTTQRLLEWLTYTLYIAGFDHVYLYDNSDIESGGRSLQPVVDLFPPSKVTRISWPHRVCNNNRPMHANAGERSSQYAAETSCRIRYGPFTQWISHLDVDEYLVPQTKWNTIREWLINAEQTHPQTKVWSFFQTRAVPNIDFMEPLTASRKGNKDCPNGNCLLKRDNVTFLQSYDCEKTPLPKPDYGWRAKKQIYKPTEVLNHFVHYSVVTKRILSDKEEPSNPFVAGRPFEERVDEVHDAFMLHTKTTYPSATKKWREQCAITVTDVERQKNCPVGIPYNESNTDVEDNNSPYFHNCYLHPRIQQDLVPRLEELLAPLRQQFLG